MPPRSAVQLAFAPTPDVPSPGVPPPDVPPAGDDRDPRSVLRDLVANELDCPVDARVAALAATIAGRYGAAARAVLFYGSCLRERAFDGAVLDFYLIVSSYREAYRRRWLAAANRLVPPNVFPIEADGLAAKYAVLSEADFARLTGPTADNPAVWARFAQPARIAWAADERAAAAAVDAVACAAPTLLARTLPLLERPSELAAIWHAGFALTYASELRAERGGRCRSIVDAEPERYRRFAAPALAVARGYPIAACRAAAARRGWRATHRRGKLLTIVRLIKASATYAGGIDYLAWKIERHAGTPIALRRWRRRWPVVGALTLLPRLLRRGMVR